LIEQNSKDFLYCLIYIWYRISASISFPSPVPPMRDGNINLMEFFDNLVKIEKINYLFCLIFMRALLIGRFQPFHKGHAYLVDYFKKYEIIFAIGSAYESFSFENPFTAGERYEMIYEAMLELDFKKFFIVPVPDINRYGIYAKHVEDLTPSFDFVISNNKLIKELFMREGYEVRETELFNRKEYQGKFIRNKIAKNEPWEHLVPKRVANFIKKIKGEERIRKLKSIF